MVAGKDNTVNLHLHGRNEVGAPYSWGTVSGREEEVLCITTAMSLEISLQEISEFHCVARPGTHTSPLSGFKRTGV